MFRKLTPASGCAQILNHASWNVILFLESELIVNVKTFAFSVHPLPSETFTWMLISKYFSRKLLPFWSLYNKTSVEILYSLADKIILPAPPYCDKKVSSHFINSLKIMYGEAYFVNFFSQKYDKIFYKGLFVPHACIVNTLFWLFLDGTVANSINGQKLCWTNYLDSNPRLHHTVGQVALIFLTNYLLDLPYNFFIASKKVGTLLGFLAANHGYLVFF